MSHAACLLCHAVTEPNFTLLELRRTIGYPSAWILRQKRKEESSWSECPVTEDPSYLNNCPNDIVSVEAVAMANEECGLDFWGWSQTKFLLKGISPSVNLSLRNSDYTVSPYGFIANVTRSGIWLLRLDVILLNSTVHSYVHNFPPLAPILSQMNLVLSHPLPWSPLLTLSSVLRQIFETLSFL